MEIIRHIFHVFLNWSGSSNPSGNQYGFFSGFGSDLGEFLILGSLVAWWKTHECHVDGCHKFGKHKVADGKYVVCKKHHPDMGEDHKVTMSIINKAHKLYNKKK